MRKFGAIIDAESIFREQIIMITDDMKDMDERSWGWVKYLFNKTFMTAAF